MDIDITGINRARLLAALHNGTSPRGLGMLHASGPMTEEEASDIVKEHTDHGVTHFDYVRGRPIKVRFHGDVMKRAELYDRDAGGPGSAQRIVDSLR